MKDHSYTCVSFGDSDEIVSSFFEGDVGLIDTFRRVCLDMLRLDGELVVRYNEDIIGMAKRDEQYRFYLTHRDDGFFIKYKKLNKIPFFSGDIDVYLKRNREINELFLKNAERLTHTYSIEKREKRIEKKFLDPDTEWKELRARYAEHPCFENEWFFNEETSRACKEIMGLFAEASSEILNPTDVSILKRRVFTNDPETLRDIAMVVDFSHERVRQRQNLAMKKLTVGIYKGKREVFVKYRESLKEILSALPPHLLAAMPSQIEKVNGYIGKWLYMVLSGDCMGK